MPQHVHHIFEWNAAIHSRSKRVAKTMCPVGDPLGKLYAGLFDALFQDSGELLGARERSKGFMGVQEHFAMATSRPAVAKVFRQPIACVGREVLLDRAATFDGTEVDTFSRPVHILQAQSTDLYATHSIGAQ